MTVPTNTKKPIYVVGLPRSGTTWVGSILGKAQGVKYYHEPFNPQHIPGADQHWLKYLNAGDLDPAYQSFFDRILRGDIRSRELINHLSPPYKISKLFLDRVLPGRILIKDVHSMLSLDWIEANITPHIVIIARHPCAIAASWQRMKWNNPKGLFRLLEQERLIDDYLLSFMPLIHQGKDAEFLEKIALYWGITYSILLEQIKSHPHWLWIRHEDLCEDPIGGFKTIFDRVGLPWSAQVQLELQQSTTQVAKQPYSPQRITSQEATKWKKEFNEEQMKRMMDYVHPFGVPGY